MGPSARETEVGDGLITYFRAQWSNPSLVDRYLLLAQPFDWLPGMADPASWYPCNPILQCPGAYLRLYTEELTLDYQAGGQVASVTYNGSIWYYRRQVLGENHQRVLSLELERARNPLLVDAFKPVLDVTNFRLVSVIPGQTVFHNSLEHEFGDPTLRVSVGEVPFVVKGALTIC